MPGLCGAITISPLDDGSLVNWSVLPHIGFHTAAQQHMNLVKVLREIKMEKLSTTLNDLSVKAYVKTANAIRDFGKNQQGVTAIEYAIVAVGVATVVMFIFGKNGPVKDMLTDTFSTLGGKLSSTISSAGAS